MAGITKHQSAQSTKLLLIGDSGSGKTGSLVSLVLAGYKLRIYDLDNGVDIVRNYLTHPKSPYAERAKDLDIDEMVKFQTFTEHMKQIKGRVVPDKASVWTEVMDQLDHWKDSDEDLGKPRDWGPDTVVVVDSLTFLSQAAFAYVQALQGRLGVDIMSYGKGAEPRRDVFQAQDQLRRFLQLIYDDGFKPNVIVTAHVRFLETEGLAEFGKRGYPESLGSALSPLIPRFFNNVLQCITTGEGRAEKHQIVAVPWGGVKSKSSAPFLLDQTYDISDGLAKFFNALRGGPPWSATLTKTVTTGSPTTTPRATSSPSSVWAPGTLTPPPTQTGN